VAVFTTSGTAAGELLPAAMEAHYSGLPLVLVTADRPRRFRGSGAPQAAEQARLFGAYVEWDADLEGDDAVEIPAFSGPIHLNICLEDPRGGPVMPDAPAFDSLEAFLGSISRPLVLVGRLERDEREAVASFLVELGAPVVLEGLSGLRGWTALEGVSLRVCDGVFDRAARLGWEFDGLLRIGGVPTHRLWRDLEDRLAHVPVFNVSRLPFTGLSRPSGLSGGLMRPQRVVFPVELKEQDARLWAALEDLIREEPRAEPSLLRSISETAGNQARVFLGNSLPIREWDLASAYRDFEVGASRGLNGIDGQVSAFLGWAREGFENWAVLGDLTLLYDMAGFWARGHVDGTVCVINNSGGRIFERMFGNPSFLNAHELSFDALARLWDLEYELDPVELKPSARGIKLVEFRPDAEATRRFWTRFTELLAC
jgi:2-succinyl-5-enolpyruvyl-6-hydroxy-3-cyclohexene-1-carboxylate synthase